MIYAAFSAYGLRFKLVGASPTLLDALCAAVPFGWRPSEQCSNTDVEYALYDAPSQIAKHYTLVCNSEVIARDLDLAVALTTFTRHAELLTATLSRDGLFIHAGVVGWRGRAIIIPARSFSGKTTLVKALVEAGATYYSDEFAILDPHGLVHPYTLPLSLRDTHGQAMGKLSLAELGGQIGTQPIPVGLAVITRYQRGAKWRPRPLSAGQALLALMDNAVAARGDPDYSMPILRVAVMRATVIQSKRGEAERVAQAILHQLTD